MLISSALSACDPSQRPVTRLQSSLFASPPASPPSTANSAFGSLVNSCRALQSILTAPSPIHSNDDTSSQPDSLPTPPMSYAPLPPIKMRLRSRKSDINGDMIPRKKIVKRRSAPARGINKRRREIDDDMGRDDDIDSELDITNSEDEEEDSAAAPSTPKRARIAPETIPLGLEPVDFHQLHTPTEEEQTKEGTEIEVEADGERWSLEDDRMLVELVLSLKLPQSDLQECARSLGKDPDSMERRWKSLIVKGDVGLRSRSRRTRLHNTWR
ncbi:hypothetical protein F5Y16DRAFT_377120 [Xylariaceae sp. FL0255]|nr:hypothetical protein F5Y16DRAFT_377120 [Xylariaceae sp. FL0255]